MVSDSKGDDMSKRSSVPKILMYGVIAIMSGIMASLQNVPTEMHEISVFTFGVACGGLLIAIILKW